MIRFTTFKRLILPAAVLLLVNYLLLAPVHGWAPDAHGWFWLMASAVVGALVVHGLSQHSAPQREIERLNRLYGALSQVNQAVARSTTREALFQAVCDALVERGGLSLAWIGWHDPQARCLQHMAHAGQDSDYLKNLVISTEDQALGQGPSGTAFREARPYICNDYFADPATLPWRTEARRRKISASAALPIVWQGRVGGVMSVYAHEKNCFQDKEIALLEEVANDLAMALDALDREAQRQRAEAVAHREQVFSSAMVDSMPGIVYFYDEQGRFLRWNQNFLQVSGYSAQEMSTMHPLDFFAGDEKALLAQKIAQVHDEGEAAVEATFVSKDGRTTPYFFTGKRVVFDGLPCLVGVGMDITENRKAQLALKDYAQRLQATSRQLLEVQENERRALARELHDSVGQELTALSLNLSIIGSALPADVPPAIAGRLEDSQQLLEDTSQHLRGVMIELRPPGLDELGLLAALKEHAQRVAQRSGLALHIVGAEPQPRLPPTVEIALFRIVQEALNNTVKHAQASEIGIDLHEQGDRVWLMVTDNGRGFEAAAQPAKAPYRMGMTTMRERAEAVGARLQLDSDAIQGTRISIEIPRPT